MINNPQNTRTSGISDDSTLPPNRQLEQANTNAIGFDENDQINQNENQGREVYTNNALHTNQMTKERHVEAVATR